MLFSPQDDTYAEVSDCNGHRYSDKYPDKSSATPPLEMKERKPDDSPSAVQISKQHVWKLFLHNDAFFFPFSFLPLFLSLFRQPA